MPKNKSSAMSSLNRRQFIYYSALAASATALSGYARPQPRRVSPNEKLNIGVVGAGGKGRSDTECCSGENIVALCDVDANTLEAEHQKHPKANAYKDFRKMLEKEKTLDAVIVATPDHLHATVAAMAIK